MKLFRALALLLVSSCAFAQTYGLAPVPRQQFLDVNGHPLAGGLLYSYAAGTSTPLATYASSSGPANPNPAPLDSGGFASIWLSGTAYKLVLTDSAGVQQWSVDNVSDLGLLAKQQLNGLIVPASQVGYTAPGANALASNAYAKLSQTVSMEDYTGSDCGAQLNAAYAALGSAGGVIYVHTSCSFSTPVVFGISGKAAILAGGGSGTTLTYTGTSGTALTLNNSAAFDLSSSIRDIVLTGPGPTSSTVGIQIGGSIGCAGCSVEHSIIQSFGTGLRMDAHEWITRVSQSMLRANGTNLLVPSGTATMGENLEFSHVTFADAPPPHTNSVWVQGSGAEVAFTDCSFDQAQLRVGNSTAGIAQVNVKGSHFENPNWAVSGSVNYDFVTMDNNNGNFLRLTDSYFLQDASSSGPARLAVFSGGKVVLHGIGMFSPIAVTNFAVLANAVNVDLFSFNDLGGNIGGLFGGSTTGYVLSLPGANTGTANARNLVAKAADAGGGAAFDLTGDTRVTGKFISLATSGPGLVINSVTPIQNLFANVTLYSPAGVQQSQTNHIVQGITALSGGSATVSLSGSAVFTSGTSYVCVATDQTSAAAVKVAQASGSSITLSGTGTDNVSYMCLGN